MDKISPDDVRKEVQRFWDIVCGKRADKLDEMYAPTAIAFSGKAKRSESAKLMAVRRSRQLPGPDSGSSAEVGAIDVQIAGPDIAIAAYTYSFNTTRHQAGGAKVHLNTPFGRATQIFRRGEDGALRIVHEHLSAAAPPSAEKGTK